MLFVYNHQMENNTVIVDSAMSLTEALAQNPNNPAPEDILQSVEVLEVEYFSFDGKLHKGQIVMNKKVIGDVEKFFKLAKDIKFPIEKVIPVSDPKYQWDDVVSCDDNNSAGFNFRLVQGTSRLSKHAQGLAFDINPVQNIYVRYGLDGKEVVRYPKDGRYDVEVKGTLVAGDPLVTLMKGLGWEWGGDWTPDTGREDYQHFEKNIV